MAVAGQRCIPRKAPRETPYENDEKEIEEEGDWKVEECAAWRKVRKGVGGRGGLMGIGVEESADVEDRENGRKKHLRDE